MPYLEFKSYAINIAVDYDMIYLLVQAHNAIEARDKIKSLDLATRPRATWSDIFNEDPDIVCFSTDYNVSLLHATPEIDFGIVCVHTPYPESQTQTFISREAALHYLQSTCPGATYRVEPYGGFAYYAIPPSSY